MVVAADRYYSYRCILHFAAAEVPKADHNCLRNLVASIESFDCSWDSSNQSRTGEGVAEVRRCGSCAGRVKGSVLNME